MSEDKSLIFEGEKVDVTTIKLQQFKGAIKTPLVRGERFHLTLDVEVVGVMMWENKRNGKIYREHVITVHGVHDMDIAK